MKNPAVDCIDIFKSIVTEQSRSKYGVRIETIESIVKSKTSVVIKEELQCM